MSELPAEGATGQLLLLRAGSTLWAVPVADVREILRTDTPTPVPMAPDALAGLICVRGEVVAVVDLAVRLGLRASNPRTHVLIEVCARETVSLAVDEVLAVSPMATSAVGEVVGSVPAGVRAFLLGTCVWEGRLVAVLDAAAVSSL